MSRMMREIAASSIGAIATDEAGEITGRYLFDQGFSGFAGHFPGRPILPAIVEVMTVVALVSRQTGRRQRLVGVQEAKFPAPVAPGEELLVRCRQRTVRGKLLWDAQLSHRGKDMATMLVELEAREEQIEGTPC